MHFESNSARRDIEADIRTSLLDLLREHLQLSGTKKGCNQGACGVCTVLFDAERNDSCLAVALQYECRLITTIEGLDTPVFLHPFQRARTDKVFPYRSEAAVPTAVGVR